MNLSITIPGIPQPQGSKINYGRFGMAEANKNLKPWRAVALTIAADARQERLQAAGIGWVADTETALFSAPVSVHASFYFPRPKHHYGTGRNANVLKPTAPNWHGGKPDCDKLQRALGDVLTQSGILRDDSLIAEWQTRKRYSGDPRVEVLIGVLP